MLIHGQTLCKDSVSWTATLSIGKFEIALIGLWTVPSLMNLLFCTGRSCELCGKLTLKLEPQHGQDKYSITAFTVIPLDLNIEISI